MQKKYGDRGQCSILSSNSSSYSHLQSAFEELKSSGVSIDEAISFLKRKKKEEEGDYPSDVPVGIFHNQKISALEAIVKFLKENRKLNFSSIAFILNRNDRTIWATYSNARKKMKEGFVVEEDEMLVPLSIISKRRFSVLESLSFYLHEAKNLPYHRIAMMLGRDDRTIWTVCDRVRKKQENEKK